MIKSPHLRVFPVLIVVVIAVITPVLVSGYRNLILADEAFAEARFTEAEQRYEWAARQLFWQGNLWEKAGTSAQHAGNVLDTIRLLLLAKEQNVISAQGWEELGAAYWAIGERTLAIQAWIDGSIVNPHNPDLLDRLALAYQSEGNYTEEESILMQRLELGESAEAHYRLGLILMLSDAERAKNEFKAASKDQDFKPAAITLLAALSATDNETDASRKLLVLGRSLGLVEEWGLASMGFERSIHLNSKNAEAYAWLGESLQHLGKDGVSDLDRAVALDPNNGIVRLLRGLYWRRSDDNDKAVAEYLIAAGIEPHNPSVMIALADAYAADNNLPAALSTYQMAAEIAPSEATYWRMLAMFCADNDVQILEIGLPAAKKAAEFGPRDPYVLDTLGWSYAQAGYSQKAEQILEQAIKSEPNLTTSHLHLAVVYLRAGNRQSALEQLLQVIRLDSKGSEGVYAKQLLRQYFPLEEPFSGP